jgi:hypothetical protein
VSEPERTTQHPQPLTRPLLWTMLILCVAYLPLFFGKITFFRDIAHWGFPARAFVRASLMRGELPVWNPYQGLGFPVFGDPLYGVFYPPNWLYLLVGPQWVASMFNWQCFAHLVWGTAGVCWLARRLGASSKAIMVAGLAWGLSGYTTSQWSSGLLLLADAWIPWAAVGHVALLDSLRAGGPSWRRGLLQATVPTLLAVLLGEVFLACIGAGFGLLFALLLDRVERKANSALARPRPAWLATSLAAVSLAMAAGAVVLVPARTVMDSSERAGALSRVAAEICSLHPLRLVEMVAPQSMGDAYGDYPAASVVGEAKLDGLPLSYSLYMGASVVVLALAAFGRRRRLAATLAGLLGFALLLSMGKHTPVHAVFRRLVFPLSYMRYPEKYAVLVVLLLALLAALGTERVLSTSRLPWRRGLLLIVLVFGFGLLARLALPAAWAHYAWHGAWVGALSALAAWTLQRLALSNARLAGALFVMLVAVDLATASWPLQAFGGRAIASSVPPAARLVLHETRTELAPPRIYRSNQVTDATNRWLPPASAPDIEPRLLATLITNTANAWGIATLPGYDAAVPRVIDDVWKAGLSVGQSALRLLGASYTILPVSEPKVLGSAGRSVPPADERPGLDPVMDPLPGARLYRVPRTLPRVYWARHAEILPDAQALARLYEPDVVMGNSVWLAPDNASTALGTPPGRGGECHLTSFRNARLSADCTGPSPGVVVFVEQYARGWQATIDGQRAPILRANLLMRALSVSPGRHHIELWYVPPGLDTGEVISILSLALLAGIAFFPTRRNP